MAIVKRWEIRDQNGNRVLDSHTSLQGAIDQLRNEGVNTGRELVTAYVIHEVYLWEPIGS